MVELINRLIEGAANVVVILAGFAYLVDRARLRRERAAQLRELMAGATWASSHGGGVYASASPPPVNPGDQVGRR